MLSRSINKEPFNLKPVDGSSLGLRANVGLAAPQNGLQSSSIGIIDVSRIMSESPQVKASQEELNQIAFL
jgi:Skp family chaperone for outer membrane proteins